MEGIYFIHTRECFRLKENIYKLGRSYNLDNRVKQYPNDSKILFMMKCNNSKDIEKYLIKLFKKKFIQKTYYGTEYFEGDVDEMINEIYKYLYRYNTSNTSNKINNINSIANLINVNNVANVTDVNDNIKETIKKKEVKEVKEVKYNNKICPNCKYECKFPSLLKLHFRKSYHCLLTEEEIDNYFNKSNNTDKCNKCNKNFDNRQAYLRHQRETKCSIQYINSKIHKTNVSNISNLVKNINPDLAKDILNIIINQ